MAKLLFTTEAFKPFDISTPGVPILLDAGMRLVEPACAWFLHVAVVRGRTRSPETWRTYGESLYDWWQTLEANAWAWDRVGIEEVAAYRDRMLRLPSDHTGRPYARSTINIRVRILALFYRWCTQRGLIIKAPFAATDLALGRSRQAKFLTHVDASAGVRSVNELTLRETRPLPRPLAPETIRRVMAEMGARDRLIVEWAVTTGARRMEIAGLRMAMVSKIRTENSLPITPIRLDTTKGGCPRSIYPPKPLLDRTRAYIREERAIAVRQAKISNLSYQEPASLFLTRRGTPISARRVGAVFAGACIAAGVDTSFHALRHTFATVMLRFLQKQTERDPEMNPLLTLQTLLGHADLATTSLYLRVLASDLSAIEAAVDDLYEGFYSNGTPERL